MIVLANAPVSYGVFGLARPDLVSLPSSEVLLKEVFDAGYEGIDLGPHGLFGSGRTLVERLAEHGLGLSGGWLDFPFAESEVAFRAALDEALPVLEDFALVAQTLAAPAPLPTIADRGSAARVARPGGGSDLELDADRWKVFAARIEEVAVRVRDLGLEPTFHHHACTYVETSREIDRLLADTSIGLTFDTGHLLVGGGDPVADYERWAERINHLHLKDVRKSVLEVLPRNGEAMRTLWEQRAFVPLGEGDLDMDSLLQSIQLHHFSGWMVVEQDVVLLSAADVDRAFGDQRANREVLRRWFG